MTEENEKKDQGSSCGCGRGGKWIWIGLAVAVFAVLLLKNPREKRPVTPRFCHSDGRTGSSALPF